MKDVEDMVVQIKDVISQVKSGKPNFEQLLSDAQHIMTDVQAAQTDCKLSKVGNLGDCTSDLAQLVQLAQAVIADGKSLNFPKLVSDVQQLVATAQQAATDCTSVKRVGDMTSCIADVEDAFTAVKDIVSQVKSGSPNMAKILEDVQQIMGDVSKAEQDCQFGRQEVQGNCVSDLQNVVNDAVQLVKDASAKNIGGVLNDLKQLETDIKSAKADCNASNDLGSCMTDIQKILATGEDIYSQVTSGSPNLAQILQDVQDLMAEVKQAEADCKNHKIESDDETCNKDVRELVEVYKKMWVSAKASKADELKRELSFMMKDNTEIQSVCHLQGQCMQDSQDLQKLAERMMHADLTNQKVVYAGLKRMGELMRHAQHDCGHEAPVKDDKATCQKDLRMLAADYHKMWVSAKAHKADELKRELSFMMKDNTEIQSVCHLQGACMQDSQYLSKIAAGTMKANEEGDWKEVFRGLMAMKKTFAKAGQDCHHSPAPAPHMKCHRDIRMLQKDLHMMMETAKKHDSEHLEKEVKFLEHELPNMETDCEMKGMCKKDFDALEGMTQRLESVVEAKNWKATDEALMVLFKSFKAAGQDCMHHKTGRKHHKKHHRHHKVTHKLHKMDFLKQYKRTDDDQCKADITNMMADIRKMVEDVKAHNANATEATLKYIVDHMPQLEKQCQLQGDCAKDFWMVDGLAKRMMESVAKGDWNATDQYLRDMDEVFHKAHSDCQAGPGPSPDQCKQDAENLEADVHKIFESTHARDQKAVEAELQYLIKEMPMFEDACHLAG